MKHNATDSQYFKSKITHEHVSLKKEYILDYIFE
jgi:hypothetical protein